MPPSSSDSEALKPKKRRRAIFRQTQAYDEDRHPMSTYLDGLSVSSRRPMRVALDSIADILSGGVDLAEAAASDLSGETEKLARRAALLRGALKRLGFALPAVGILLAQKEAAAAVIEGRTLEAAEIEAGMAPVVGNFIDVGAASVRIGLYLDDVTGPKDQAFRATDAIVPPELREGIIGGTIAALLSVFQRLTLMLARKGSRYVGLFRNRCAFRGGSPDRGWRS